MVPKRHFTVIPIHSMTVSMCGIIGFIILNDLNLSRFSLPINKTQDFVVIDCFNLFIDCIYGENKPFRYSRCDFRMV